MQEFVLKSGGWSALSVLTAGFWNCLRLQIIKSAMLHWALPSTAILTAIMKFNISRSVISHLQVGHFPAGQGHDHIYHKNIHNQNHPISVLPACSRGLKSTRHVWNHGSHAPLSAARCTCNSARENRDNSEGTSHARSHTMPHGFRLYPWGIRYTHIYPYIPIRYHQMAIKLLYGKSLQGNRWWPSGFRVSRVFFSESPGESVRSGQTGARTEASSSGRKKSSW